MENFNAHKTELDSSTERRRKVFSALAGAALSIFPQDAEALEFPEGTDWRGGLNQVEETMRNEVNEWSFIYLQNEKSGGWHSPTEHGSVAGEIKLDEQFSPIKNTESSDKIVRLCHGHTHPAAMRRTDGTTPPPGPSHADMSQQPKLNVYLNELAGESPEVFADNFSVIGMTTDRFGVWYYQDYDRDLVQRSISEHIKNERDELIDFLTTWLIQQQTATGFNTEYTHFKQLMLEDGINIDQLSPSEAMHALWQKTKFQPEFYLTTVGPPLYFLLRESKLGPALQPKLQAVVDKSEEVSTKVTMSLEKEITNQAMSLEGNEREEYVKSRFPDLATAYKANRGTLINFLTYEEAKNAPPCPPIDYRPEQSN